MIGKQRQEVKNKFKIAPAFRTYLRATQKGTITEQDRRKVFEWNLEVTHNSVVFQFPSQKRCCPRDDPDGALRAAAG